MTTDIERLEGEIAEERATLMANLALLEDRARALTDWKGQVRKRPFAAVGAAAVGGLLLAVLTDGSVRPAASPSSDGIDGAHARPRSHPLVDRLVTALAVAAAERLFAAIGVAMPEVDEAPDVNRVSRTTRREGE